MISQASSADKEHLLRLYEGRKVFHGELHDHSDSGGTSDGKVPLAQWPEKLKKLNMDFAAILDHRQVRHMYQPEWEDGLFIPGTEPGTTISDSKAEVKSLHYNIIMPERDEVAKLISEFPEYNFTGGIEGHFVYPSFTIERFGQLIDAVKAHGGFFVIPHPKQIMVSDDPLDYWFRDGIGIEVFYISMDSEETKADYQLWVDLLAAGKRVWASAGCDLHSEPRDTALTTIYAESGSARSYLSHLSKGDYTCGPVGIRMCLGDTLTGGQCEFSGGRLTVCAGDMHRSVYDKDHRYRLDLISDAGIEACADMSADSFTWISVAAENRAFYRAEVFDITRGLRIAVGNPVWNTNADRL